MTHYAFLDPKRAKQVMLHMFTGDRVKYIQVHEDENWEPEFPDDAEGIHVTGTLRGCGKVCGKAMREDAPMFYMDNGYGPYWKRVTYKGTAPTRLLDRPDDRTPDELKALKPWRGGKGNSILILPPSLPYMAAFDEVNWVNEVIHSINEYTGRNLIIRPKPAKGKKAPPWQEQLDDAYCVVSFGSALAVDAMVQGVPTISYDYCPNKFASFSMTDLETDRMTEEPDRMKVINNMMYHSFHKDEFLSGKAWTISMENANG